MTEYAAIRIVFTLQGLRTCTNSPHRPPIHRPTDSEASVYRSTSKSETNRYGTILSPQVGILPSQEVALELCGSPPAIRSLYKAHGPPASGLLHTTLPLIGLVSRIASSDRVHPDSG